MVYKAKLSSVLISSVSRSKFSMYICSTKKKNMLVFVFYPIIDVYIFKQNFFFSFYIYIFICFYLKSIFELKSRNFICVYKFLCLICKNIFAKICRLGNFLQKNILGEGEQKGKRQVSEREGQTARETF